MNATAEAEEFRFIDLDAARSVQEDDFSSRVRLIGDEELWNVVVGCTGLDPLSAACASCEARAYGMRWMRSNGYFNNDDSWNNVLAYDYALTLGPRQWGAERKRILVAPAGDLFHPSIRDTFIDQVLDVIEHHPQHSFFVVTRNGPRMAAYMNARARRKPAAIGAQRRQRGPLPNLWVGVSVEDQRSYFSRVPLLMQAQVARRFVVIEPLTSPIRLEQIPLETRDVLWPFKGLIQAYIGINAQGTPQWEPLTAPLSTFNAIDWVVVGGYRGAANKPMHPRWVLAIQRVCQAAGVPMLFKSWGDYVPVRSPDMDGDETLLIVSPDGKTRGRGDGAKTNYLSLRSGEGEVTMTRKSDARSRELLGPQVVRGLPEHAPARRITIVEHSLAAQKLKKLSDTQAALRALTDLPSPEPLPEIESQAATTGSGTRLTRALQTARDVLKTDVTNLAKGIRG